MRIGFVCSEYPPAPHGGIGTYVRQQAVSLANAGHDVTVIGYDSRLDATASEWCDGVQVIRLARPAMLSASSLPRKVWAMIAERKQLSQRVQQIVKEHRLQLVESHDWSGPLWFRPSVPLLVRLHGAATVNAQKQGVKVSRLMYSLERRNIFMANGLCAVSQSIGHQTLDEFKAKHLAYSVIYNGIDTQKFCPIPSSEREPMILYAGSIKRLKGVGELVKAMRIVWQKFPCHRLALVGNLPLNRVGEEFKQELLSILPPNSRSRVDFVGHVPHETMPCWYSRAQVGVFPSHTEAFGLTCAEAMACSCAVVMTSRGSGPELVTDQQTGLLADPSQTDLLAEQILRLLQDDALRVRCGNAARQSVVERFDQSKIFAQNLVLYQSLINRQ